MTMIFTTTSAVQVVAPLGRKLVFWKDRICGACGQTDAAVDAPLDINAELVVVVEPWLIGPWMDTVDGTDLGA